MTSYQAPVSAIASFGLSFSTAVFTAIMSMISPGTCEESKTFSASGLFSTSPTCGFQVTTAPTSRCRTPRRYRRRRC
jgi:hypothetical protein